MYPLYIKCFLSVDFAMNLLAAFKLTVPSWLTGGISQNESNVVLTYFPMKFPIGCPAQRD